MSLQTTIDGIKGLPWETVIKNLAAEVPQVLTLVESVAYLLGIIFTVTAFVMAARSANPSEKNQHGKHAWVWSLGFGALMMALPTTLASIATTMFGAESMTQGNSLAYLDTRVQGSGSLAPLEPILAVIGLISVIRGLVVLRTVGLYGNHSRDNATFSRGMVLVIAGVFLVHMKKLLLLVSGITGLSVAAGLF